MKPDAVIQNEATAPETCPFCGASTITSTGGKADASMYWRCLVCGEMWNVGRLRASNGRRPLNPQHPWL